MNQLKCINGQWLTYKQSEKVSYEEIYIVLPYLCRDKQALARSEAYFRNLK